MTGEVIKINWREAVFYDSGIRKFKDTNLPLDGKYEDEDGDIHYFKKGKYHNENVPAFIRKDGFKVYYIDGKRHRLDGPAIIFSDGSTTWCINDNNIKSVKMNNWLIENDIPLDWNMWTDSDKMLFALHWSDYSE